MILLDTDTLSLLMAGQSRVVERERQAKDVGITLVSRIEVLRGRFDALLMGIVESAPFQKRRNTSAPELPKPVQERADTKP